MSNSYTMYIILNSDLKMTPGQMAAQVSHITQVMVDDIIRCAYESMPMPVYCINYQKWKQNPITIILKAPQTELEKFTNMKEARSFIDSGVRLGKNILTGIGFFPSDQLDNLFVDYKLV